jgi:PAS domain S-box-containing protein
MPRKDDLKNRLDELFSSPQPAPMGDLAAAPDAAQPARSEALTAEHTVEQVAIESPAQATLGVTGMLTETFSALAVGLCITGVDGRFAWANQAFCQMLGYSLEELVGSTFQAITHPEDLRIGGEALRAMLAGEQDAAAIQKRYLTRDQTVIWVDLNVTLIKDAEGKPLHFITLANDITGQKQTAIELEKRLRELRCLSDIGHRIDEKPALDDFLEWVAERVPSAFQMPESCIAALEYGGRIYGNPQALEQASKNVGGLRIGDKLVGWLHIAYTQPGVFVDEESALIGGIVSRVCGYIDSQLLLNQAGKAEAAMAKRVSELAMVAQISTTIATILDPGQMLQQVVDLTKENFYLYHVHIYLLDEATQELKLAAGAFEVGRLMVAGSWRIPVELEKSLIARSARERRGVIVNDVSLDPGFLPNELLPDTRSEMAVPMLMGGRLLGILDLQSEYQSRFTEEDVTIFIALASQISVALENARQYEETIKRTQELGVLNEMGRAMSSLLDVDRVLGSIYRYTARLMPVESFFVAIYDEETQMVTIPYGFNDGIPTTSPSTKLGHGMTDYVLRSGEPLLIARDVMTRMSELGIEFLAYGDATPPQSWLGVPVLYGEKPLGAIVVQSVTTSGLYGVHEQELLLAVASQAANSLANARQYERAQAALSETSRSQNLLRTIIDSTPDWIFAKDREHRMILANKSFAESIHYDLNDVVGKHDLELGFPEENVMGNPEKGIRGYYWDDEDVMAQGKIIRNENEQNVVDGRTHFFSVYKGPLIDADGNIYGLLGYVRDVTEREQLLHEIQERANFEQRLRELSDSVRGTSDPEIVMRTAVRELGKVLGRKTYLRLGSEPAQEPAGDSHS